MCCIACSPARLERATRRLGNASSIRLSYGDVEPSASADLATSSLPTKCSTAELQGRALRYVLRVLGTDRTCGLRVRNPALFPLSYEDLVEIGRKPADSWSQPKSRLDVSRSVDTSRSRRALGAIRTPNIRIRSPAVYPLAYEGKEE